MDTAAATFSAKRGVKRRCSGRASAPGVRRSGRDHGSRRTAAARRNLDSDPVVRRAVGSSIACRPTTPESARGRVTHCPETRMDPRGRLRTVLRLAENREGLGAENGRVRRFGARGSPGAGPAFPGGTGKKNGAQRSLWAQRIGGEVLNRTRVPNLKRCARAVL